MISEFRAFILKGNVIDLAVAVIMGAAFGSVVSSLVEDVFTPLIGALLGAPDFGNLELTIGESAIQYGSFLNAGISFLLVAGAVFFFLVKPMNLMLERMRGQEEAKPATTKECPECLSTIPIKAKRCAHCTAQLAA